MNRWILLMGAALINWSVLAQVEISGIPNQTIGIGGSFEPINLANFSTPNQGVTWEVGYLTPTDPVPDPGWTVSGTYQFDMSLTAQVSSKGTLAIGSNHSLAVVDAEGEIRGVAQGELILGNWVYFLTAHSDIPGEELFYRFYNHSLGQIIGSSQPIEFTPNAILGQPDDPVTVEVGVVNLALAGNVLTPEVIFDGFVGTERVQVTVRSIADPSVFDTDVFNLIFKDDFEPSFTDIPDQTVQFGGSFSSFDLDDYVIKKDTDGLAYFFVGQTDLEITLSPTHVISISYPPGWHGTEQVTFTVIDNTVNAFSDSEIVTFTVRPEEMAPEVSGIEDQEAGINGFFAEIPLNNYLTSNNPAGIEWSYEFVTDSAVAVPDWTVNSADFQFDMNITARAQAFGKVANNPANMLAAFRKSDGVLLGVTSPIAANGQWYYFLTINENSAGSNLDFKLFEAGSSRILPIESDIIFQNNAIVGDPIEPVNFKAGYLDVSIDENDNARLDFVTSDWFGVEVIRFIATDVTTGDQLFGYQDVTFEVLNIQNPALNPVPDQTIQEGSQFTAIDLDQYLNGVSPTDVVYSILGGHDINARLEGSVIKFDVPENYFGISEIVISVKGAANDQLLDQELIRMEVINVNDVPEFLTTPELFVQVGELYTYEIDVIDLDDDEVTIQVIQYPDWLNFFGAENTGVLFGTPGASKVGDHSIIIVLSDGIVAVTQEFTITVTNEPIPVLTDIPSISIMEGEMIEPFDLAEYLSEMDASKANWSVDDEDEIMVSLNGSILSFDVPVDFHGSELLTIKVENKDFIGFFDETSLMIEVINVNDPPVFNTTQMDVTINEGQLFLYQFSVSDIDSENLTLSASDLPAWLSLSFINGSGVVTGRPANSDSGANLVSLTLSDGEYEVVQSFTITVEIEEIPILLQIQDITGTEDVAIDPIDLSQYLTVLPLEDASWILDGADDLSPMVSDNNLILNIPADYFGEQELKIRVANSALPSYFDEQTINISISPMNDPPVFTTSKSPVVMQHKEFYSYQISVTDVDNDVVTISAPNMPEWLTLTANNKVAVLTGIPDRHDGGSFVFDLVVSDGVADASQVIDITVEVIILGSDPEQKVMVFPNPATDFIILNQTSTWKLLDMQGRVLQTGNTQQIDLRYYKSGIYVLEIETHYYSTKRKIYKH